MNRLFDRKLEKDIVTIMPGEVFFSCEDLVISTLLGSCVSVSLYDPRMKAGGLNHFMLVGDFDTNSSESNIQTERFAHARYGMFAMESLINGLLKLGCRKENLEAKVFGGGNMLFSRSGPINVAEKNILFALDYLKIENIKLISSDTGGDRPRRVLFFPKSGQAFVKKTAKAAPVQEESVYQKELEKKEKDWGDPILF